MSIHPAVPLLVSGLLLAAGCTATPGPNGSMRISTPSLGQLLGQAPSTGQSPDFVELFSTKYVSPGALQEGVAMFRSTFESKGMNGVVNDLERCAATVQRRRNANLAARCVTAEVAAYMIDQHRVSTQSRLPFPGMSMSEYERRAAVFVVAMGVPDDEDRLFIHSMIRRVSRALGGPPGGQSAR
jgi:hypothetical protein